MKKVFLLSAMAVLALSSCVKDTVVDMQKDEIKFSVTTDVATKAGAVATTMSNISDIRVLGYTGDKLYLNEIATKITIGQWDMTNAHFWPNTAINFYAVNPKTTTFSNLSIPDYSVSGSEDLLYAAELNCIKPKNLEVPVTLNFRHGLSRLIFKAKTSNNSIGVEINEVKVQNIYNKGTLTFPSISTSTDIYGRDEGKGTELEQEGWGTWNVSTAQRASYTANTRNNIVLVPNTEAVFLTKYTSNVSQQQLKSELEALFVLPQTLKYWDPETDKKLSDITTNKAYFIISCKVWETINDSKVYLCGASDSYQEIAVPVVIKTTDDNGNPVDTFTWKQGMQYIYTFDFSKGAGYVPPTDNGTGGDEGNPVLVPIKINISIDEFQTGTLLDTTLETE